MESKEFLRAIFDKYNFDKDTDIFMLTMGSKKIPIVTKLGMQKIVEKEGFICDFDVIKVEPDYCAVRCDVYSKDITGALYENVPIASSFGSAESSNVRNKAKYYLEMAEKRAKVRAVLIAIDKHGLLYSEEEADEFKK